ncbi:MAG: hypothetical protein ACK59G_09485, partial [Cyanobacteriota bacterium]
GEQPNRIGQLLHGPQQGALVAGPREGAAQALEPRPLQAVSGLDLALQIPAKGRSLLVLVRCRTSPQWVTW